MKNFLLEIGVEELPPSYIGNAIKQMESFFGKSLETFEIPFEEIELFSTPRRLTIKISNLPEKQKDKIIQKVGPRVEIAYNQEGNLTKAALGFLRNSGGKKEQLFIKKGKKTDNIAITYEQKGINTQEILRDLIVQNIKDLKFPKSMKWSMHDFHFARPIRWIVALWGKQVIKLEIAGVTSDNFTFGHRFFGKKSVIDEIENYQQILLSNRVVCSPKIRKKMILDQFKKLSCQIILDDKLLETVTNICEYPVVMMGRFDKKFLKLPRKIIITTLSEHQKCFAVEKNGNIINKFVFVSNGKIENETLIKIGNEKVAKARLSDAKFFFEQDTKIPFVNYHENLSKVTFQISLGSVLQKVKRIELLAKFVAKILKFKDQKRLLRVVKLCKCDLATQMLGEKEFTKLQGYMGQQYALASNEDKLVSLAIYEHYMPKNEKDDLPTTILGSIIAICDKVDTVCGIFSIGLTPTGSTDPFALRRAANGVCRIIFEKKMPLDLEVIIDFAFENFSNSIQDGSKNKVKEYFFERIRWNLKKSGYSDDLINAIVKKRILKIDELRNRLDALRISKKKPEFVSLILSNKRICNILNKAKISGVFQKSLLIENEEKLLYNKFSELKSNFSEDFSQNIEDFAIFSKYIDIFFDKILINTEVELTRINRLNLLYLIKEHFSKIADFTKIIMEN